MRDTKLNLEKLIEKRGSTIQRWISEGGIKTYAEFLERVVADNLHVSEQLDNQVKELLKPVKHAPVNMEPEQPKKTKKRV